MAELRSAIQVGLTGESTEDGSRTKRKRSLDRSSRHAARHTPHGNSGVFAVRRVVRRKAMSKGVYSVSSERVYTVKYIQQRMCVSDRL